MGMFDSLLNRVDREREGEERRRQAVGLANEDQRLGYYTVSGGADMGQGFGKAIGSALGADMRSEGERATDKVRGVESAAKGLDTSDPEYLAKLSKAFQDNGMIEEAMNAQKAYEAQIVARQTRATAEAESARKARADERLDAHRTAQNEINTRRLQFLGPKAVQLGTAIDAETQELLKLDPKDPRRDVLLNNIDSYMRELANTSAGKLTYQNAGDKIYVMDQNGNKIKELAVGAKPLNAKDEKKAEDAKIEGEAKYKTAKQKLQSDYDAVVELYNHPGLAKMVGPVVGTYAHLTPEKSGNMENMIAAGLRGKLGQQAFSVYQRVRGGAFINALAGLKAASTTGATGLGAVSEVEGSKVQASMAALNPQQDVGAVRAQLKKYAEDLAELGAIMDARAAALHVSTVPLKPGTFTGPGPRSVVLKPTPAAAAPAQAEPATPTGEIKMLMPADKNGVRKPMWVVKEDVPMAEQAGWSKVE